ncbi:MAG: sugar transferase [Bacteroidetes bacterium]|nr:sugar transferase [Bacteroidota bacterium]
MRFYRFIKRIFDLFAATLLLLLISPLTAIIIMLQFILYREKVFFCQPRVGENFRIFNIFKFKTMLDLKDAHERLLPDELRVTWFGYFLRAYHLDEIPQLINIINGDLSFVGPRPLLREYLAYYHPRELQRHSVRPGLTGLAQVKGGNAIDWDSRFQLDLDYIASHSLLNDLKIIILTFFNLFKKNKFIFSISLVEVRS